MLLSPDEKLLWGDALTEDGDGGGDDDDENDGDGDGGGGGLTVMVPGNGGGGGRPGDRPLALPKLSLQFLTFPRRLPAPGVPAVPPRGRVRDPPGRGRRREPPRAAVRPLWKGQRKRAGLLAWLVRAAPVQRA